MGNSAASSSLVKRDTSSLALPNEILQECMMFASPRDLCAAATVSRRFNTVCMMPKLWWRHISIYYPSLQPRVPSLQFLGVTSSSQHPKRIFLTERRKRQRSLMVRHEFAYSEYKRQQRTWWVQLAAGPCFFIIMALFTIAGIITAMFKFDSHDIPITTFIPWFLLIAFVFVVMSIVCLAHMYQWEHFCGFHSELFPDLSHGIPRYLAEKFDTQFPCFRGSTCIAAISLCVWLVFVALRISRVVTWNWVHVFIPAWIVFGCFVVLPCSRGWRDLANHSCSRNCAYTGTIWVTILCPLLTVFVLFCIHANNGWHADAYPSFMLTFIPFFIIDLCMLLFAMWICIREWSYDGWKAIALWCMTFPPFVAFKVLLATFIDEGGADPDAATNPSSLTWTLVLIPMLVSSICCLAFGIWFYREEYRENVHGCLRFCEPPPDRPDLAASQLELV